MSSSPEPRPAVPLEYEPESARRRQPTLMLALIALGLAVVVGGWFIALSIRRPATRQIVVTPLAPAQPLRANAGF